MSQAIVWNGSSFTIPDVGETDWGQNLTDFFVAIPQGALQKSGGTFTLTADVNFGANFGLISLYYKSRSSNLSTAGILRLAVGDTIGWRNNANDGNLLLAIDGSNNLTFNGLVIVNGSGQQTLTNKILSDSTVYFGNVSDVTKTFKVSLGGATTGTATTFIFAQTAARSITIPDATDTLALLAATQTLTNKTISRASNTLSGYTAKAVATADGSGNLGAGVAPGSAGNVLTSDGSDWISTAPAANVVTSVSTTYTALTTDNVILADATGGSFVITLPAATNTGTTIQVIKVDSSANTVTVQRAGSDTIMGVNSRLLRFQYEFLTFTANGTATWYITDQKLTTNWASYTVSTSGWGNTVVTYTARFQKVNDSGIFQVGLYLSNAPTGTLQFSQSDFFGSLGLTLRTAQIVTQTDNQIPIGIWEAYDNGAANYSGGVYMDAASGQILFQNGTSGTINATSPFTWGNTDSIAIWTQTLPITGWET